MKQHSVLAITAWLVFVLLCGVMVSRSHYNADLSAFLPSHPSATQQLFVDQLHNGIASRLILIGIEGADEKSRANLSKTLAQQLRTRPEFISINNGERVAMKRDRQWLFTHRYLLSPAVTPDHFSAQGLHNAISDSIDLLASPAGMLIKPLFKRDPTGEMLQLMDVLDNGAHPRMNNGVWVSRDGKRAILLAQTRAAGSDIDAQQQAMTQIREAFTVALKDMARTKHSTTKKDNTFSKDSTPTENHSLTQSNTSAHLIMTGPGVFSVWSRATIKQEVTRLSILSTIIIVTLLLTVYRSIMAVLLGILPIATGIMAGIVAVSLGFGVVHGITLGFGITLIGEAVDYSIYLFVQSQRNRSPIASDNNEQQPPWLQRFWPTIRLGVATSVFGFTALMFSGFPGLAQLGLYSTTGLITAALVTRYVMPVLLPRSLRIRDISPLGNLLHRLSRKAQPLRWLIVLLTLGACLVLASRHHNVWNNDIAALSPVPAADRALDADLRNDLGAPDPRYLLVVSGNSMDAALAAAEKVSDTLNPLVSQGVIAGYDSPSRYLPSTATQRQRQAALPSREVLSQHLAQALTDLPLREKVLADFINDVQSQRDAKPVQKSDLAGTSMAMAVDGMLVQHGNRWSALLPLRAPVVNKVTKPIDAQQIRNALALAKLDHVDFVDVKTELDQLYTHYLHAAISLSLGGLAAIVVLLIVALRSLKRALRIVLPLGCAVIIVIAGLIIFAQTLTILHLVGMLLIVAVGSNYALFFDKGSRDTHQDSNEEEHTRTLASALLANITTVTVFGLLAFSQVPVLQNIGITVAPGVILALLFSAIMAGPRSHASAPSAN